MGGGRPRRWRDKMEELERVELEGRTLSTVSPVSPGAVPVSGSPAVASCLTTNAAAFPHHTARDTLTDARRFSRLQLRQRGLGRCCLNGATPGRLRPSRWARWHGLSVRKSGRPASFRCVAPAHKHKVLHGAPAPEETWMLPTHLHRVGALRGDCSPEDTSCRACNSQPIGYFPIDNRHGPPPLR